MPPIRWRSLPESDGIQLGFGLVNVFTSIVSIVVAVAAWRLPRYNTRSPGEHPKDAEAVADLTRYREWELKLSFGRRR